MSAAIIASFPVEACAFAARGAPEHRNCNSPAQRQATRRAESVSYRARIAWLNYELVGRSGSLARRSDGIEFVDFADNFGAARKTPSNPLDEQQTEQAGCAGLCRWGRTSLRSPRLKGGRATKAEILPNIDIEL